MTIKALQATLIATARPLSAAACAGPDDRWKFDPALYQAQKAMCDFNLAKPNDVIPAFGCVPNRLKALKDAGVTIHICSNAARSRGHQPEDFHDVTTVVPAAVIDIAKRQNQGYSHTFAGWYPRLTREEFVRQHPELQ